MLASFCFCCNAGWAGIGTSTLTAQSSVATNCSLATSPVAFNTYDPIGANATAALNATGSITITCVKGTTPTISLSLGANASGSTRRMRRGGGGGFFLTYELYQPPSNVPNTPCSFPASAVWRTGGNRFNPSAAPDKNPRVYYICGTVPAGQNPAIGNYSDTVVATVTF
jgi:spore coat protein U domain-containing protein, fimbrial subunit CupE1/2/3/6